MASLDIEQAARASGLTARDVRLLIERGKLPASRPAGRWLIDQRHLAAAATALPEIQEATPLQDDSVDDRVNDAVADGVDDPGTLLARLEEAEAQIADLREERDELRLRLREQVSSLQHSLEDSMEELDEARERIAELERDRRRPRPRAVEPPAEPQSNLAVRDALTPLFRATTQARDVGSAPDK